jgi:allophanate hydrolase subunit 1
MQLAPAGDRAILADLGEVTAAELHAANARACAVRGVVRSIPGHSSLYVIFEGAPDREALRGALETIGDAPAPVTARTLEIPVHFDGAGLREFLSFAGVRHDEFLRRVDGLRLVARYLGFRGGFAYLDGWPVEWSMPRRPTSRPVQRGAFAIAGGVAAFYPIDSPGGWNVLGHTGFDLENAIAAGDVLKIQVVDAAPRVAPRSKPESVRAPVDVLSAPLAIWTTKPFDTVAAAAANAAAGNADDAALFECPLAGPRLRFAADAVVAWCAPSLEIITTRVRAGEEYAFGRVTGGLRAYLAIGQQERAVEAVQRGDRHTIHALAGPHDLHLGTIECEVTPQLDRVGIRLRPLRPLNVTAPADLRSIGMQCGTVQLHPDGSLVAMGPDHPVTGGYAQPMTVLSGERWKLAQLVPGERVTLVSEQPSWSGGL